MEEVNELLRTWQLEYLIPEFNKQQVTMQALSAMTDADIKELIPLAGPRALFMRCWRVWKTEFLTTSNFSLFDSLLNKDLIVIQESSDQDKENQLPILDPNSEEVNSQCTVPVPTVLENLLKESLDSASLLAFKGNCLIGDSARNLLASVIAKAILTENKNSPINGAIYYKWAHYITKLFPGERTTTYYIPACTTANGIKLQAKGKLVNQVLNKRRQLQNLGALPKGQKRSREESPTYTPNPSPRPLPSIYTDTEENLNVEDDLQWIENSSDPWSLVEDKWEQTHKARTRILYDSNIITWIEKYFEKYPALRKPQGYTLLLKDFSAEIYKDNLFINYPLLKIKLEKLLTNKKSTETYCHNLVTLFKSSSEETSNLAGFLSIPYLLNTTAIKKKQKRTSEAGPSNWKPSRVEVREGFIKHVTSSAEISQAVEQRLKLLNNKGLASQPYMIVVGETLEKINNYLIIANRTVIYERQSILHAVDTCYKIIWALNLEYGMDTYPVWYFIQKAIYKMTSSYDKGSTAVESLLTDCKI